MLQCRSTDLGAKSVVLISQTRGESLFSKVINLILALRIWVIHVTRRLLCSACFIVATREQPSSRYPLMKTTAT